MKYAIIYATTEGQTRKIARFCADRLAEKGHSVEMLEASDAEVFDPGRFGGAILGGSLHMGKYQTALQTFASANADALNRIPTLFLSVSLATAGKDAKELADIADIAAQFSKDTGWIPGKTVQVAGALRFSEYDFFRGWAMRWIASRHGLADRRGEDVEFTDWAALSSEIDDWAA